MTGAPGAGHLAYDGLRQAMVCYEKAIDLRPPGDDEAVSRWNTCARIIARHPDIKPAPADDFEPVLEQSLGLELRRRYWLSRSANSTHTRFLV